METKQKKIGEFMRWILFLFIPFLAQALEFQSSVSKKELALTQSFELRLEFESDQSLPSQVECPGVLDLKDFQFIGESQSGPNFSVMIVNGQMTQSKNLVKSYILRPKAMGTFTIPVLEVLADGQSFQTQAFEIKVVNAQANITPSPGFGFKHFNPFGLQPFDLIPDPFKEENNFQLKLQLGKKEFYQSEAIRANWFLYSTSRPSYPYSSAPYPPLKGFWLEEITHPRPVIETEAIGDTLYRKILVKSLWLFPLEVGTLNIEPYSLNLFSFSNRVLSSPIQTVRVKKLPLQGKDFSFTGAVGDFKVDFILEESEVSLEQPFSFKIKFKGSGHPRFIRLPNLSFPSSVQTYDPVEKSNFENGIGTKEYEILILPKQEGELILPSFILSTFNPKTGKYIRHKSSEFKLFVKKGVGLSIPSEKFFENSQKNNKELKSDFDLSRWIFKKYKYWAGLLGLVLVFLALAFLLYWLVKKRIAYKKHSIKKQLNYKLLKIQKLLTQNNWQKASMTMIQTGIYVLSCAQMQTVSPDWRQSLKALPPSIHKKYAKVFEQLFVELESLSFSKASKEKALSQAKLCFIKLKKLSQSFLKEIKSH